jgi:hypothetical protein
MYPTLPSLPSLRCGGLALAALLLLLLLPAPAAAERDCFAELTQCMGGVTNEGLPDSSACTLEYFDCLFEQIVVA